MSSQAHSISMHNSQTRLLSLPVELKNEIYQYAFDNVLVPSDLNLLLACRQIQHEAQGLADDRRPIDVWDKYNWYDEEENWNNSEVLQDLRVVATSKRNINYHLWNSDLGYDFDFYMHDRVFAHVPRLPDIITLWNHKGDKFGYYAKTSMLETIIIALSWTDYYYDHPVVVRIPLGPGDRKSCKGVRADIAKCRLHLLEVFHDYEGVYLGRVRGKLWELEQEFDVHLHNVRRGVLKIRVCTVAPVELKLEDAAETMGLRRK